MIYSRFLAATTLPWGIPICGQFSRLQASTVHPKVCKKPKITLLFQPYHFSEHENRHNDMTEFKSICFHPKALAAFLILPVLAIIGVLLAGNIGMICGVAIGGGIIGHVLTDLEKKSGRRA